MGRGKGRAKGIDVTKHFFQPSGPSDRILVQVSPAQTVFVTEEDLSPTQGSEAALAVKREGRMEGPMRLCANWRQGACHNHAACGNAHVLTYFNTAAAPMGNVNSGITALGGLLQRPRDNGTHSTPQQQHQQPHHQHQHQHQQQQQQQSHHPHNFHTSTISTDSNRQMEQHKTAPSTSAHSTLIPAPRSQQANRQTSSLGVSSTPMGSSCGSPSWGRNVVGNGNQHGNPSTTTTTTTTQQPQPHHHHHHHHHHHPYPSQQHEARKHPQSASSRVGWGAGHRAPPEDANWTASLGAIDDMLLGSASHQHAGKNEGTLLDISFISNLNNSNTPKRGEGVHFSQPETLTGALNDDTWVDSTLAQTSSNTGIWYDGSTGLWDFVSNGGTTTTCSQETTKLPVSELPIFPLHEPNTTTSVPPQGELWGAFINSNGDSTARTTKPVGVSSPSEALKNQLLRELVGAGGDAMDTPSAEVEVQSDAKKNAPNRPSTPLTQLKSSSELLSGIGGGGGGGGCGSGFNDRGGTLSSISSTPSRNAHTIQHLMSLLTKE